MTRFSIDTRETKVRLTLNYPLSSNEETLDIFTIFFDESIDGDVLRVYLKDTTKDYIYKSEVLEKEDKDNFEVKFIMKDRFGKGKDLEIIVTAVGKCRNIMVTY